MVSPELLLEPLKKIVDFTKIKHFVVEVYPRHDLERYLKSLKKYNITKIILGVQALNNEVLQNENRFVTTQTITDNFKILSKSNLIWSVDLIYGLHNGIIKQNYLKEIKNILKYHPHGFHLYNTRGQEENSYYFKKKERVTEKGRRKFMDPFDFEKISSILIKNKYKLIRDEWCLMSNKQNKKYAKRDAKNYGEQETLGLGLWARSRNRKIKYRNEKRIQNYGKLLDKGLFPIEKFFNYKDKYFLIANLLLSINQSSSFNLTELFSIPHTTDIEKEEVLKIIHWLKYKKITIKQNKENFIIPRSEYSRSIMLIEKYLKDKSGQKYFYKN